MDPVSVEVVIARPREEVFAYLADIANHPEFTDHYLKDWHLTREDTWGSGAGARFRVDAPLNRFGWADMVFHEVESPRRILGRGRGGKFNRIRHVSEWVLSAEGGGDTTRVELTTETQPELPSDRFMEVFGGRGWFKRNNKRALRRLRTILEDGRDRGERATMAGGGAWWRTPPR